MREFLFDFLRRVAKDWCTYASTFALVFAMIGSTMVQAFLLPTWVWWLAAFLTAGAMTMRAEWNLHSDKKAKLAPFEPPRNTV